MEDLKGWDGEWERGGGEILLTKEQEEALLETIRVAEEWERNQEPERGKNQVQLFEKLMSVEEVAGALRIAPQTLRNWVAMRRIPFVRIGGKTRFRWKSVEAWLERKEFQQWQ